MLTMLNFKYKLHLTWSRVNRDVPEMPLKIIRKAAAALL